jgi:hypothetical protein
MVMSMNGNYESLLCEIQRIWNELMNTLLDFIMNLKESLSFLLCTAWF